MLANMKVIDRTPLSKLLKLTKQQKHKLADKIRQEETYKSRKEIEDHLEKTMEFLDY